MLRKHLLRVYGALVIHLHSKELIQQHWNQQIVAEVFCALDILYVYIYYSNLNVLVELIPKSIIVQSCIEHKMR